MPVCRNYTTIKSCYYVKILTINSVNFLSVQSVYNQNLIVYLKVSGGIVTPYHADFLKWNNPTSIFGTIHYHI